MPTLVPDFAKDGGAKFRIFVGFMAVGADVGSNVAVTSGFLDDSRVGSVVGVLACANDWIDV